ncbi:MAG: tetratricopeptide repeat protein [Bryobacteraceae bacterium]|nr:tetratricopeptide repeat protein [Bryobacteraceae bacterium]
MRFPSILAVLLLAGGLAAAQEKPQVQEPPEEDEGLKAREYGFNPLQASKEIKVGLYYLKKGSVKAAANRFEEATKWDPTSAEAWLRLGEARERLKNKEGAREAYAKYLEAAPDAKNATAIRKKLQAR